MTYTKKELLKCLASVEDDAEVQINIVTRWDDGTESGGTFQIEAFSFLVPTVDYPGVAQLVCYDLTEENRAEMDAFLASEDTAEATHETA